MVDRSEEIERLVAPLEADARRLTEEELDHLTTSVAGDPALWAHLVPDTAPQTRQRLVLHRTENLEVLLLIWPPREAADWHDHGGASGGYAVVQGELFERYRAADGAGVLERSLTPGSHGGFGACHVHDMVPVAEGATVSVHAYSPPIETMTYYERTRLGFVAREVVPED